MNDNEHSTARRHNSPRLGIPGSSREPSVRQMSAAKESPISALLEAGGHSLDCVTRVRSGQAVACSCGHHVPPAGDAAVAVGLAIRFARIGATHGVPVPPGVLARLIDQVDAGDPAAILVWQWLAGRGQVTARVSVRPKLRLISGETR